MCHKYFHARVHKVIVFQRFVKNYVNFLSGLIILYFSEMTVQCTSWFSSSFSSSNFWSAWFTLLALAAWDLGK